MPPEIVKLLRDMHDAATKIARFTHGKTYDQYASDEQLQWSVERGFEIVGEALSQLRKINPTIAERITDWKAIIGFRNVLIHGYSAVDYRKTWDIVQSELPVLRQELDTLFGDGS
jgi:uncharacterized protein with HEPN domain